VSEARFQAEAPRIEPAERASDRNWALTVMDNFLHRLREEVHANGNTRILEHLSPLLSREPAPGEFEAPSSSHRPHPHFMHRCAVEDGVALLATNGSGRGLKLPGADQNLSHPRGRPIEEPADITPAFAQGLRRLLQGCHRGHRRPQMPLQVRPVSTEGRPEKHPAVEPIQQVGLLSDVDRPKRHFATGTVFVLKFTCTKHSGMWESQMPWRVQTHPLESLAGGASL
jgi:hypothetical protein